MREELHSNYHETRDALDQRWVDLLLGAGFIPILVPNDPLAANLLAKQIPFSGILLSGGNTLSILGGSAKCRDKTEKVLLDIALEKNKPVLGVCRGFQFILNYYGEKLVRVKNHVGNRHLVKSEGHCQFSDYVDSLENVNSYHQFAASNLQNLKLIASSTDNYIEAARHHTLPVFGIMWHPERDKKQLKQSRDFLHYVFS